jgi:Carboxypeptidase regulatory-like domain
MKIRTALTSAFLGALVFAGSALAQKSTIQGSAADTSGKPLKNAEVRIQNEKTKTVPLTVKTDAKGHFVAAGLPVGVYTVSVVLNGTVKWSAAHVKAASGKVVQLNLSERPAVTVASAGTQPKKRAVWIPDQTGSRLGGHWEDEPVRGPGPQDVDTMSTHQLDTMQRVSVPPPSTGGR